MLAASERYVEYDRAGRVIKGVEVKAKSRFEEDVLINNHTCVWGSWWRDGTWGFACCHSTVKNSYCTGKASCRRAWMYSQDAHKSINMKIPRGGYAVALLTSAITRLG